MLVGNWLYFARDGDTINTEVVAVDNKPPHTPAEWPAVGDVEEANLTPNITEEEVYSPLTAGGYGLSETFNKTSKLTIACVIQDMSELFFELLTLSTKPVSGAIVPMSASGRLKGWWNLVQRDQEGNQVSTIEVWARAKVEATKFGNNHAKGTLTLDVLVNALNSGDLDI